MQTAQGSRPNLSQHTTLWEHVKSLLKGRMVHRVEGLTDLPHVHLNPLRNRRVFDGRFVMLSVRERRGMQER